MKPADLLNALMGDNTLGFEFDYSDCDKSFML